MSAGRRVRDRHTESDEPAELGHVLSQLFALRGYGCTRGNRQLHELWIAVAGPEVAGRTRVLSYRGGVLKVAVGNSALLSELNAFRKAELLEALAREGPRMRIRDLKFQLRTELPRQE